MRVVGIFTVLVSVLVFADASFPSYDQIALITSSWAYAYFDSANPVLVKLAWWGAFLASDGGPIAWIEQMQDTCDACKSKHEDPANTDCRKGIYALVKGAIKNVVTGALGWHSGLGPNGEFLDGYFNKRTVLTLSNHTNSLGQIHAGIAAAFVENGGVLIRNDLSKLEVRDNDSSSDIIVQVHNNTSGFSYDAIIRPKNETCGTLLIGSSMNSSSVSKRNPVKLYPLCEGYFATDYCANQKQWAGFYSSNELEAQINEIVQNDVTGGWQTDFLKLYTFQEDGKDQDWQLSIRMYYVQEGVNAYWDSCDTGS
ncbi:hypothetical protein TPHA_0A00120 [Tetrapisispora phaffii CBS 4417]|uniref:Uncharacterized protein n=1 Tax=Tetrapisispora phaffii (strain ATCC 24235 / CBS 4417 / NBRC 1672 / NRRL Y-8282 / UCD 70-5) TaxID=1071381 RepID=G8BMG9_TETPH|nr:hypothetical protein TPHA_0A00120 [Tetrapisispora phaffii CBS 4417]CCE61097.1 hypothetical protein TPHA_0A00120 [Tetrapisispora phaffii CBS 4417]